MKISSFKGLLLKKTENPSLQSLIKFVRNDVLTDMVIESLEKMARSKHKGDAANLAIRDFGVEMEKETEPEMIHDALGHHASRYKAALRKLKEDPDNADAKRMLDHHAEKIYNTVNMAEMTQKHSHGKLRVTAPSPHAWERNIKQKQFTEDSAPVRRGNKKVGEYVTHTKGWNYNGYKGNKYEFLTHPPHHSKEKEIKREGYSPDGAYPMEKIQVNGKYIDVQDVDYNKVGEDHPFDKHPIMHHYNIPVDERTPNHDADYKQQHEDYHNSPHMDSYWDKVDAMKESDPEGFKNRGSKVSDPVHHEISPHKLHGDGATPSEPANTQSQPAQSQSDLQSGDPKAESILARKIAKIRQNSGR